MAKRKRSRRKKRYKPVVSPQAARARSQAARAGAAATASAEDSVAQAKASVSDEYRYVITDLRNMGLLAAAMFALLAILAVIFG